ncbi:flagellar export protein FliJ [Fontisphaera persica]|uniref:flagellar export protein FliJ n=1 Tax=Fontisphaera persica TaxID=2974023 RepID=UPI0024C0385C|nr:flagellar export protein FliJ [Fontisphaera persica]WCJ58226.1 flagellar export protein FliJ [Fontisphaera persica]
MKKFRFTLQAVHVVRQQQERQALEAYGRCLRARQQAEAALQQARQNLEEGWRRQRELEASGAPALWLVHGQHWCALLEERCGQAETALQQAREQTSAAWARLAVARRQREAVEKLRQRQWRQYELALAREEQKQLDELATLRFLSQGETLRATEAMAADSLSL